MKIPSLLLPLLPIFALLFSPLTAAADGIQTQPAASGDMEVDVIKASVKDGILTVHLNYRNKGSAEAGLYYDASAVYYIDEKEKKKYHTLRDSAGAYLAAPLDGTVILTKIAPGAKAIVWFKFPAPPAGTAKINLVVPGVLPFEDLPISQ